MLANYEQQIMQLDPSATISHDFELWKKPREFKSSSAAEGSIGGSSNSESQNIAQVNNDSIKSNNSSNSESEEEIFHIDPYVSRSLFPINSS